MRRSNLLMYAIRLKKQMEKDNKINKGIYDLLCDMESDNKLNFMSRNREVISYIKKNACKDAKDRLDDLIGLYKNRNKQLLISSVQNLRTLLILIYYNLFKPYGISN